MDFLTGTATPASNELVADSGPVFRVNATSGSPPRISPSADLGVNPMTDRLGLLVMSVWLVGCATMTSIPEKSGAHPRRKSSRSLIPLRLA
jgi:hypothetical protein